MNEITTCYPKGYYEKDEKIYSPTGVFTNGVLRVSEYYSLISDNAPASFFIKVIFTTANGISQEVTIPMKELTDARLQKYIPGFFVFIQGQPGKHSAFLRQTLNLSIADQKCTEYHVLRQGYNLIGDSLTYVWGNTMIYPPKDMFCTVDQSYSYEAVPFNKTSDGYLHWIQKYCQLSDCAPVILLSSITAFLGYLYDSRNIGQDFCVLVHGATGNGKTESVKLVTGLFKDSANCVSLMSEKEDIFRLSYFHNCPVLVDDLNKTDSGRVQASNESKVTLLIQQRQSGGRIRHKDKNAKITGMVFITAERIPKNESTINRCILVNFPEVVDADSLTWLQQNRDIYLTFVESFINWVCQNHEALSENLQEFWDLSQKEEGENPNYFSGYRRVAWTERVLTTSLKMLRLFFHQRLGVADRDQELEQIFHKFDYAINECVEETLEHVRKESEAARTDYIDILINYITSTHKAIAGSYEEYCKHRKNDSAVNEPGYKPSRLFFIESDCFCIRGDDLLWLYQHQIDKIPFKVTKKAISAQFNHHGLLEISGGELSYSRREQTGLTKKQKTRYYHIRIKKVLELMDEIFQELTYHELQRRFPERFPDDVSLWSYLN